MTDKTLNKQCAIVISSFDGYADTWTPFFQLFFRYWPDCPFPVYLISNYLTYCDPRVTPINIIPDRDWSTNLKIALQKINTDYIIYLQEDYFLKEQVDTPKILKALEVAQKEQALHLRLIPDSPKKNFKNYQDFKEILKDKPYLNSTQAAIWETKGLIDLLREGESGWDFEEKNGIKRARKTKRLFLCAEKQILNYLKTAIIQGKWHPQVKDIAQKENLTIRSKRKTKSRLYLKLKRNIFKIKGFKKIYRRLKNLET